MQVMPSRSREPGDKHEGTFYATPSSDTTLTVHRVRSVRNLWQAVLTGRRQVGPYAKYPLVDYMHNPVSSHAVTAMMKTYYDIFGRSDEIMTDGGAIHWKTINII